MRLALASAFRNCGGNVSAYMTRVLTLRDYLGPDVSMRLIAGEGDSIDYTRSALDIVTRANGLPTTFVECAHGERIFGSTEEPDRLRALSFVFNAILSNVSAEDDLFLYVEQDLRWEPSALRKLIELACVREGELDVFAPLVMAGQHFYDTWAFRIGADRFSPFYPFHAAIQGRDLVNVDSVGSCLAMRGKVAREVRIRDDNAIVGWCADARAKGYRIGVACDVTVRQA